MLASLKDWVSFSTSMIDFEFSLKRSENTLEKEL